MKKTNKVFFSSLILVTITCCITLNTDFTNSNYDSLGNAYVRSASNISSNELSQQFAWKIWDYKIWDHAAEIVGGAVAVGVVVANATVNGPLEPEPIQKNADFQQLETKNLLADLDDGK